MKTQIKLTGLWLTCLLGGNPSRVQQAGQWPAQKTDRAELRENANVPWTS
jgi:hypothetical protein